MNINFLTIIGLLFSLVPLTKQDDKCTLTNESSEKVFIKLILIRFNIFFRLLRHLLNVIVVT
jgi:hypothetical protein